jgi:integrase
MSEPRIKVWLLKLADRPFFKLEWLEPGTTRRRSISTKTADPDVAEQMRRDKEYELNHGLASEPCKITWQAFSGRYLAEKLADRRANTRGKWQTVSASFLRLCRPRSLGDVDASMLSRYAGQLRQAGHGKATVAGHLAYLRAALRWAARVPKLIPQVPVVDLPKLPKKSFIRRTDHAGFLRILNAAPSEDWRLLISVAWYTGRRRGELLALEWSGENGRPWLDLERERLWLPAAWNKGDADFWLPLHPDLVATLRPVARASGRVFPSLRLPNEVSRGFTALARSAGVPITLHDFKRSFASRYAPLVPAQQLQRLCGHADIRTTLQFYADLSDGLDEAIRLA